MVPEPVKVRSVAVLAGLRTSSSHVLCSNGSAEIRLVAELDGQPTLVASYPSDGIVAIELDDGSSGSPREQDG